MLKGRIDLSKGTYCIYGEGGITEYNYIYNVVIPQLEEIKYEFVSSTIIPESMTFQFTFNLPNPYRLQYYINLEKDYQQKGEQNNNECCIKCPKRKCQFCSNRKRWCNS